MLLNPMSKRFVVLEFAACVGAFAAALPGSFAAQQIPPTASLEIDGHHIGEPVKVFLRLEREARDEVEVCRENPGRSACAHLLAAVDRAQRAEVSTSAPADFDHPEGDRDTTDFVLDGGKLVKITKLVNEAPEELKALGRPSSEKSVPAQNSAGAKWENRVTIWETTSLYVSLSQDNNPSLHDHRFLVVFETPAEHLRENPDAEPAKTPTPAPTTAPETAPSTAPGPNSKAN
jgi:hypothetical protein